ncbi:MULTISPECIES: L,D-transpeptidase family protein [Streptomyces]|uniref:L,D-transpeptidase family protein n=1 Tax=Streptomyces TaxID=1883 RepID=UPI00293145C1|nr:L,D-transpeptidase family protein [Streptomyces sasae]
MIQRRTAVALLASPLLLSGCGGGAEAAPSRSDDDRAARTTATPTPESSSSPQAQGIPGLGPRTTAAIPERAEQVVVAGGRGKDSPLSTVVLYERDDDTWQPGASWPAHNGRDGWSEHHLAGDLRSPVGVYGLTDAGGLLTDPGSRLPYHQSYGFRSPGTGFEGEPLEGSFDYVVAINYNRQPGTSPLDWTRPMGAKRGGGVWLHVDHGGPTHACVSVAKAHMKELLRTLDPDRHPVVVMGYADWLAQ